MAKIKTLQEKNFFFAMPMTMPIPMPMPRCWFRDFQIIVFFWCKVKKPKQTDLYIDDIDVHSNKNDN